MDGARERLRLVCRRVLEPQRWPVCYTHAPLCLALLVDSTLPSELSDWLPVFTSLSFDVGSFIFPDWKCVGGLTTRLAFNGLWPLVLMLAVALALAARNAVSEIVDFIVKTYGYNRQQAYIIASVAVDLRIAQLVDAPNVGVNAILPLDIFNQN